VAGITVIYDGECPFCANYIQMMRLRDTAAPVRLVDARSGDPTVSAARARGIDLDTGMLAIWCGQDFVGPEAAHLLALLSGNPQSAFVRAVNWSLRTETRARIFYPLLRTGRNAVLWLLGRSKIADAAH